MMQELSECMTDSEIIASLIASLYSDGETIVSANEHFELGFFSPGSSNNRYLGIWYKDTSPRTIAWVANRINPVNNTLGIVKFDRQGTLSIVNGGGTIIWSSNSCVSSKSANPVAQLMDDGNLVIKDDNSVIWQSFDYPGDTYLPGMKVGKNLITGRETYLRSWKSADDPSPGEYTVSILMAKVRWTAKL
ncbi:G-type lectin S-receptor-like serine/threonine-protein kinase [Tanacetum coccineum]